MAPPSGRSTAVARAPRREASPPRPRLRVVREASRLRPGLIGTVVITLVFSTLFVLAFMQAVLVQGQLHLDQLDRQITQRETERAKFRIEVATAEAPERIQAAAAANGLVSPPDVVFVEPAKASPIEPPPTTAAPVVEVVATPAAPDEVGPGPGVPAAGATPAGSVGGVPAGGGQ